MHTPIVSHGLACNRQADYVEPTVCQALPVLIYIKSLVENFTCVMQANKLDPEGAAVKGLVKSHPEGKTYFKEANGAVSLSSRPQTPGGCPLKFPGTSALFWDRIR